MWKPQKRVRTWQVTLSVNESCHTMSRKQAPGLMSTALDNCDHSRARSWNADRKFLTWYPAVNKQLCIRSCSVPHLVWSRLWCAVSPPWKGSTRARRGSRMAAACGITVWAQMPQSREGITGSLNHEQLQERKELNMYHCTYLEVKPRGYNMKLAGCGFRANWSSFMPAMY